jgi:tRNA-dihydrouridine synthase
MKANQSTATILLTLLILFTTNEAIQIISEQRVESSVVKTTLTLPSSANSVTDLHKEYIEYMKKFGKEYATREEEDAHFKIYCQNVAKIEAHNKTNSAYKQGINKFTDLNEQEFQNGTVMTINPLKLLGRRMSS